MKKSTGKPFKSATTMPRANRHYIPGCVWHITHRCHKKEFLLKFVRDDRRYLQWTESISVGSEAFVTAMKERLGFREQERVR